MSIPIKYYLLSLGLIMAMNNQQLNAQQTPFEKHGGKNITSTYEELLPYYQQLASGRKDMKILDYGKSDVGKPIQLIVLSADGDFDPKSIRAKGKTVMLINNGIHPGEPEGIDASMMFIRDILKQKRLDKDLVLCVIPVYNIAGMLNRGESRVNQNGPEAYGFRGSAQHYDLNRDFLKGDTRNSRVFQEIFNTWDPDVFFDTHTSNGADYQYTMTLIETQKDKLHPQLAPFMREKFTEVMYAKMKERGFPMIPYVNSQGEIPETGIVSFLESPRYSTGYAALHHTIGYMPETHMWKPYADRVKSTYDLMDILYEQTRKHGQELHAIRSSVKEAVKQQKEFPINWKLNTAIVDSITFLGFESGKKASQVSGLERLYYDRKKPFKKNIPYFTTYEPTITIKKPKAYILPQGYDHLVNLLQINGVQMHPLERDTLMDVEMYYIDSYKTQNNPYEGHYPHHSVEVSAKKMQRTFYAGDWCIETNQEKNRYIIETLEPQAIDSYFNWNFFDAILSQKEYFSAYIFEEEAVELLKKDPQLKKEFEKAKKADQKLAESARMQLEWIYKRSPYYEDSHNLYPVGRILK
ncbi:M14 family zinc carboxypeptidase [Sphingobacterium sp. CZ-2]|uniref:M14 family zinc carboxypeptidase n=1 Tax=Sphingobacterium sp. CZ-2 TaxID=2557994 RepID=UPI001FD66700|nr:M14 family zinc carboxypeptidase [Sphingobacterium sp. CZ-2]